MKDEQPTRSPIDEEIARLRAELEQVRQELKEANRISDAFRTKWEEITREVNRLGDERSEERRQRGGFPWMRERSG